MKAIFFTKLNIKLLCAHAVSRQLAAVASNAARNAKKHA